MLDFYHTAWLIPTLPLFAALWIAITYVAGVNRGESGERYTSLIALGTTGLALLLLLTLDVMSLISGTPGSIQYGYWFQSGDLQLTLSLQLDGYALLVATLVASVSLMSIKFSVNYIHREAGFQRFFIFMSLFTSAMLLIIMAGNALLMFVGWELAGVSSYLLIAYSFERDTATENANRAFLTNRIGDAGFILGLFLCFLWLGSTEWQAISAQAANMSQVSAALIAGSLLLPALAKSAQIPFAGWISRALEGPTPSSALFYGAIMVHAGVYLLIRLEPVIQKSPVIMLMLVILGGLSAIYGWLSGLVQTDVKSSLMFSTTAQVGLMFVACGLGWFQLAASYLVLHAMWRSYQFLHAPALMQLASRPARSVPQWLAKNHWLYNAALRRFWLDPAGDALLIKPTNALATDLQNFDERIVNRMVGLPSHCNAVADVAECELDASKKTGFSNTVGQGRGVAGRIMESIASALHWFENHLILKGGGEGLMAGIQIVGKYLQQMESILAQPRYLFVLVAITFVVVI